MDWATLTGTKATEGSIKYLINSEALPVTSILENSQNLIYATLRCREMKVLDTSMTLADDASSVALPARFLEPISLFLTGDDHSEIAILDEQHFEERMSFDGSVISDGMPSECTFDATNFYFNATADQAAGYPIRMWCYKRPALLSASNTTNFLTDRYSYMLEAAIKHFGFAHRQHASERDHWLKVLGGFIAEANKEADYVKATIRFEHYWNNR